MRCDLIVSFPDQSERYAHGFEAGMIWQRMQAGEPNIAVTARAENREALIRMASAAGYTIEFGDTGMLEWEYVRLAKGGGGGQRRAAAREDGVHAS